jgi:CheY-like chemotaxis protein
VTGTGKNGARKEPDLESSLGSLSTIGWVGLRLLLEKSPAILWTTDRELRLQRTLGSGLAALGQRIGEAEALTVYELFGNRDHNFPPVAAHVAALRGEGRDLECEWNGRLLALRTEPLRDGGGTCVGVVGVALDITDQRNAERESRQYEAGLVEAPKETAFHRLLRLRLSELADVLSTVLAASERLGNEGTADRAASLEQLHRSASRGADVLRELRDGMGETSDQQPRIAPVPDGGETILLVDDEPQVRGFVRRALEENGYRVLETSAVDEALALGASYPGRIHLLLTDVVLPGMSGPQLAARLAPLRPEMRILYMTGYADDAIVHRGVISAGQALLVKPFTSLGLAHEVKKALRS